MTPERFYAALMAFYPKAFRDAYGNDVLEAFHELRRTDRRPPIAFWRSAGTAPRDSRSRSVPPITETSFMTNADYLDDCRYVGADRYPAR